MPLLIAVRKFESASGHSEQEDDPRKCSSNCPWYTETGKVKGINGPLKTHCRMTMHPWMVDCDQFDPKKIETLEITEQQWGQIQQILKRKAKKQRKLYPEEHEEIHAVGCEWTRSKGRWNADKSSNVEIIG